MSNSLRERARRGVFWVAFSNAVKGLSGIGTITLLAYFLTPMDLGLISIVSVVYMLSEALTEFSIAQSVIAKGTSDALELSSLLWVSVAIGIVVALITLVFSETIAKFYDQPTVAMLLKVLVAVFLITPFGLIQRALLQRELRFQALEVVTIIRSVSTLVVTGLFLFAGFGAASYVFALVFGAGLATISYIVIFSENGQWHPQPSVSIQCVKKHFSFGFYVTTKQLANFLGRYIDELIIGKLIGIDALGIYHFGKRLVEKPMFLFSSTFSRVSFPVFSKLTREVDRLRSAYLILTAVVATCSFALFAIVAIVSPFAISALFPDRWTDSIIVIQIFCASGAIYSLLVGFSTPVLYAAGRPRAVMYVDIGLSAMSALSVFVAAHFSLEAVASVVLTILVIKLMILQSLVNSEVGSSLREYLQFVGPPAGATGFALAAVLLVAQLQLEISPSSALIFSAVSFACVYSITLYVFDRHAFSRLCAVTLGRNGGLPG